MRKSLNSLRENNPKTHGKQTEKDKKKGKNEQNTKDNKSKVRKDDRKKRNKENKDEENENENDEGTKKTEDVEKGTKTTEKPVPILSILLFEAMLFLLFLFLAALEALEEEEQGLSIVSAWFSIQFLFLFLLLVVGKCKSYSDGTNLFIQLVSCALMTLFALFGLIFVALYGNSIAVNRTDAMAFFGCQLLTVAAILAFCGIMAVCYMYLSALRRCTALERGGEQLAQEPQIVQQICHKESSSRSYCFHRELFKGLLPKLLGHQESTVIVTERTHPAPSAPPLPQPPPVGFAQMAYGYAAPAYPQQTEAAQDPIVKEKQTNCESINPIQTTDSRFSRPREPFKKPSQEELDVNKTQSWDTPLQEGKPTRMKETDEKRYGKQSTCTERNVVLKYFPRTCRKSPKDNEEKEKERAPKRRLRRPVVNPEATQITTERPEASEHVDKTPPSSECNDSQATKTPNSQLTVSADGNDELATINRVYGSKEKHSSPSMRNLSEEPLSNKVTKFVNPKVSPVNSFVDEEITKIERKSKKSKKRRGKNKSSESADEPARREKRRKMPTRSILLKKLARIREARKKEEADRQAEKKRKQSKQEETPQTRCADELNCSMKRPMPRKRPTRRPPRPLTWNSINKSVSRQSIDPSGSNTSFDRENLANGDVRQPAKKRRKELKATTSNSSDDIQVTGNGKRKKNRARTRIAGDRRSSATQPQSSPNQSLKLRRTRSSVYNGKIVRSAF